MDIRQKGEDMKTHGPYHWDHANHVENSRCSDHSHHVIWQRAGRWLLHGVRRRWIDSNDSNGSNGSDDSNGVAIQANDETSHALEDANM